MSTIFISTFSFVATDTTYVIAALMNLRYIKAKGGVAAMQKLAEQRAEILYAEIDRNKLFVGTAEKDSRSLMNITFVLKPEYQRNR